jgi:hypothetical protein
MNNVDTPTADYSALVAEVVADESAVTVTRADGKTATGKLAPHATEPGVYKVVTGRRGRPFTFHVEDLDDLTHE